MLRAIHAFTVIAALCGVGTGVVWADVLVTNGSPSGPFPRNKQNEPSVAVDPNNPAIMAAGANEEIDMGPCVGSSCPFTAGVGVSGIYFSLDGGATWIQPTYKGWSARTGTAHVGDIGTLPFYYESGLVSDGDPVVAFGPKPDSTGRFSWKNGSRLYYLNLAANFSTQRSEQTFNGYEAIAVSRTDNIPAAASGAQNAWLPPVIVSQRLSSVTFSDKEGLFADNAASSPNFGNVYACWTSFRSNGGAPEPILFSRSTDGGATWSSPNQLTQAADNGSVSGRQGCQVRTNSRGVVYVFFEGSANRQSLQMMVRSLDGGVSFERPLPVMNVVDVGAFDPVDGDVTIDGVAGARTDSFPSADIANGAPTGVTATDEIVLAWADARNGLNHEAVLVTTSNDGGNTWSAPANATAGTDRPNFPAVAITPNGQRIFLVYNAFLQNWQDNTSGVRKMQTVVRSAPSSASGWKTLLRGAIGDARASSANALSSEFLGDYNAIAATNTSAVAVWNDLRNAVDCPAIDAYRKSLVLGMPIAAPAPGSSCDAKFGNTDIYSGIFPVK